MSLRIDPDEIYEVLIGGAWYGASNFELDAYEFIDSDGVVSHGGGANGVCATGFVFFCKDKESIISGPLTSIQAVKCK